MGSRLNHYLIQLQRGEGGFPLEIDLKKMYVYIVIKTIFFRSKGAGYDQLLHVLHPFLSSPVRAVLSPHRVPQGAKVSTVMLSLLSSGFVQMKNIFMLYNLYVFLLYIMV